MLIRSGLTLLRSNYMYVAMKNMPGYMPDNNDLPTFETKDETEQYQLGELAEDFNQFSENTEIPLETLEADLSQARKSLLTNGFCYFQGYYYGVNEI